MLIHKGDLKIALKELLDAYKENNIYDVHTAINLTGCCEKTTFGIDQPLLLLRDDQKKFKDQVLDHIFPNKKQKKNKKHISLTYINEEIADFCFKILFDKSTNFDNEFETLFLKISNPALTPFIIAKPITINLLMSEPAKIIDLDLAPNPSKYLQSSPEQQLLFTNDKFSNPDLYYRTPSYVAGFAKIEAIDKSQAIQKYDILCKEAFGLLRLFFHNGILYQGKQKDDTELCLIYNEESSSADLGMRQIERICINDTSYNILLNNGLLWLNNWKVHKDILKAEKIKSALYWFNYSYNEQNITNKFIYALTVLECILKDDSDKVELATSISERMAYTLGNDPTDRKNIFDEFKKIYDIRSHIIHTGYILSTSYEPIVLKTFDKVKITLLKIIKNLSDETQSFEKFIEDLKYKKFN